MSEEFVQQEMCKKMEARAESLEGTCPEANAKYQTKSNPK